MYLTIGDDQYYCEAEYEYIRGTKATEIDPPVSSTAEISKVSVDFSEDGVIHEMTEIDLPLKVIRMLEDEILEELEC